MFYAFISLEINLSETLGKVSVEGVDSLGINSSLRVDIVVFPSWVKLLAEEVLCLLSFHWEVSVKDFQGSSLSLVFIQWERVGSVAAFGGHGLGGVLGEHRVSELVHWVVVFLSAVSLESLWDLSLVRSEPVAEFVLGTWESFHWRSPSFKGFKRFDNFLVLKLNGLDRN